MLNKKKQKYKFERFFEKIYKIKITAIISKLFGLIYNDPSQNLTLMQFYKNNWLENLNNLYL